MSPSSFLERFNASHSVASGRHTITLRGELDLQVAPQLEAVAFQVFAEGPRQIVLDLSQLTFMDSSGLRTVLLIRDLAENSDCGFAIAQGPPAVQRLFEIAGLLDKIPWSTDGSRPDLATTTHKTT